MIPDGKISKFSDYNDLFKMYLVRMNKERPIIISEKVNLEKYISIWRSGRRGSTPELPTQGFDQVYIDMVNRWRNR